MLCVCICMCVYVCVYVYIYIYINYFQLYILTFNFNYFNKKSFQTEFLMGAYSEPSQTFSMKLSAQRFEEFIIFQRGVLSGIFRGVLNTTLAKLMIFCCFFLYLGMSHYGLLANIFGGGLYCVETRQLTKWLSVRLRTKWFWVRVQLQSLQLICKSS